MNESLKKFKNINSSLEIIEETEHINTKLLWNDKSFMCRFNKDSSFESLEDIFLPLELSALYHQKEQKLEFIFSPLSDDHHFLARTTTFFYKGIEIKTEFAEPSEALKTIALGFRRLDTPDESRYRNLEIFNDLYQVDSQNERIKSYFKDKKPYSFYVQGDFKSIENDFVSVAKHLNIYLRFFDRKAPIIDILNQESSTEKYNLPCYTNGNGFPEQISANLIDPIAIDLLQVAQESGNSRLKYLFYYQVLEYFAYYYLDEELKRKLSNILKSPDLLHNSTSYTRTIIEDLKDYTNNTTDKQKLTKLISDYITINDVDSEIQTNIKNFCQDLEFDGGFKLPSLITDENAFKNLFINDKGSAKTKKEKDKKRLDLITAIADRIDKIRNVLVHIRESRENKVILPTRTNNKKLIPYLYLTRRIAETIAIKYEG